MSLTAPFCSEGPLGDEPEKPSVLKELTIHNFAIIGHLEVSFPRGLSIMSGETGAGKSIIVGAVNLILGSRASQEMIRTGSSEAMVEGVFHVPEEHSLRHKSMEWGLESQGEEIIIRRVINRSGRNRIYLCDQSITLQQLQSLAQGLISISGQHEHQLLLDPELHMGLLDTFGNLEREVGEVKESFTAWSRCREELHKLRREREEQSSRLDFLQFQHNELDAAKLLPGEDQELEREKNLLRHAATLSEASRGAHQAIYSGKGSILELFAGVEKDLKTLQSIDSSLQPLQNHLEQARIHLEELAHALLQYGQSISFDPGRLSQVEDRLALLQRLGKKYGGSVSAMIQRREELKHSLSHLDDSHLREEELEKELDGLKKLYLEKAGLLSRKRRETAERLSGDVQETLARLDMAGARFSVSFDGPSSREEEGGESRFSPQGLDRLQFLLSANPGEDLKPLARVASGGELSRILLALKSLLSRQGEGETLIFDEVDTGIGGRTGELVGLQLKKLAEKHQVICITHLPTIASYGDHHYKVAKEAGQDQTVTRIHELSPKDRVEELARMLGGISISEKTRAHAMELLERGRKAPASP